MTSKVGNEESPYIMIAITGSDLVAPRLISEGRSLIDASATLISSYVTSSSFPSKNGDDIICKREAIPRY